MNTENIYAKIDRVIHLQLLANCQIDQFGEAKHETVDELIRLSDTLTEWETEMVIELYYHATT